MIKRKVHRKRWWLRLVAAIMVIGLLWLGSVLWRMNTMTDKVPPQPVDVGIVLGASMWGDQPSPGLRERLDKAIELYQDGQFKLLIVTGGLDKPGYRLTEAEGMQRYLVDHGIPASSIWLENEATSTYENLLYSQRIMRKYHLKTADIITHDFHGMRALEIARFLDYDQPGLFLTETKVLPVLQRQSREVLAYGKWKLEKWMINLGLRPDV
ncbi:YdcF family protein [Paenibacillus sp. JX-17]|uniref:YdcF family protein n=1 Tax=Paenibacillus lacisoli TaxID=3064525 RepID=A0ABT9CBF8_9BACL|nr:YdcF family protein [Paenibacillus sp. JX-17]MDO7904948.1 YdcF family protein [Paenibacillus sp. JX-17]